jgi:hypothetical protein
MYTNSGIFDGEGYEEDCLHNYGFNVDDRDG